MRQIEKPPTEKQLGVLQHIRAFRLAHGYSPSFREIADHFGWASTMAPATHIEGLERRGLLSRVYGVARTTQLTEKGEALCSP